MIKLFELATNDRSMQYLYQIFGDMGGVLHGVDIEGTNLRPLSALFNYFNTVVLAIAALIVIYITVVGVMKTAHEGEMMGKQWNSLWIPIRMVMGIAALVPISAGYSGLQIVMMWIIVQGIGAADVLWTTYLNFQKDFGSSNTAKITQAGGIGTNFVIKDLYKGLICDAALREGRPRPNIIPLDSKGYYCSSPGADGNYCNTPIQFSGGDPNINTFKMGPNGACGTLKFCNERQACAADGSSVDCAVCKKQREILQTIIIGSNSNGLATIGQTLENTDYEYRVFFNPGEKAPSWVKEYCDQNGIQGCTSADFQGLSAGLEDQSPPEKTVKDLYYPYAMKKIMGDLNPVDASVKYYNTEIKNIAQEYLDTIADKAASGEKLSGVLGYAQDAGWIMAGSFYYLLGHASKKDQAASNPELSIEYPSSNGTGSYLRDSYSAYRTNYDAASYLISEAKNASNATSSQTNTSEVLPDTASDASGSMDAAVSGASDAFVSNLNSVANGVNPLVQLQAMGYAFLFIAQILFVIFLAITIGLGLAAGFTANLVVAFYSTSTAITLMFLILIPLFFFILALLITVGGMFGVYVPLIPYVMFTVGAIGWFLSCIEAMVAGPLVALGILSPSGHHEIFGKAEPALMLLFNIFLRPSLMIFGLVASFALAIVVLTLINSGFGLVITSLTYVAIGNEPTIATDAAGNPYITQGAAALAFNPLELAIILCAYVMLVVTALNKCFSVIHILPEKVMRWIGGQGEQYGEAEGVGQMKQGVDAGVAGAKSGVESTRKAGRGLKKEIANNEQEQEGGGADLKKPK